VKKVSHKLNRFSVPGFVLEQNQDRRALLQHLLGFFERVGMVEVGREQVADALKNLANQVEIFLFNYPRAGRAAEPVPARILRPSTLK
jgi:hypothetical protein